MVYFWLRCQLRAKAYSMGRKFLTFEVGSVPEPLKSLFPLRFKLLPAKICADANCFKAIFNLRE